MLEFLPPQKFAYRHTGIVEDRELKVLLWDAI